MAVDRSELIAESLERATKFAHSGIVRSGDLSRTDRERLLKNGYLHAIIKGWNLLTTPDAEDGESTAWFASYWSFVAYYLEDRFGRKYCLGANSSMELHLEATTVPKQIAVITARGGQSIIELPHGTSLVTYQDPENIPGDDEIAVTVHGLRIMSLPMALARLQPQFFASRSGAADIALRMVTAPSDLSLVLVRGGHVAAADRIIGACEHIGLNSFARTIADDMEASGFSVNPVNPFTPEYVSGIEERRIISPFPARLRVMWSNMREKVIEIIPPAPEIPPTPADYLAVTEEQYENDAYNSLSIEGYHVTPELIARMRSGEWNPDANPEDRSQTAAMAAKGYNRAFKLVEESIREVLAGASPGLTVAEHLHNWYRALFSASVDAGLLRDVDLIGYRKIPVYIKGSMHVPPPHHAVSDCMNALLDLLTKEQSAAVRAVLGHFIFVFIHPYVDGNGRLARFLMNVMLASGGYPWTVIPVARRNEYMLALEGASTTGEITPFAQFIASELNKS
ncbi:MAG: Fic family protein [Verrucomicrobia bacterium]|nr:Fic family protein [Verrucomicrobiota bacterium]